MGTSFYLLVGTGGLFDFDATLPFFVIIFITWVYLLTELVFTPLAESIEAELEETLKYQLYIREWFSFVRRKSLPLKLWVEKNRASVSLGLEGFGWVGNQSNDLTDEDVRFFYLNSFLQSLGVDSSWRFEPNRQTSVIQYQTPQEKLRKLESFLNLTVPGLVLGTQLELGRLQHQKLAVLQPSDDCLGLYDVEKKRRVRGVGRFFVDERVFASDEDEEGGNAIKQVLTEWDVFDPYQGFFHGKRPIELTTFIGDEWKGRRFGSKEDGEDLKCDLLLGKAMENILLEGDQSFFVITQPRLFDPRFWSQIFDEKDRRSSQRRSLLLTEPLWEEEKVKRYFSYKEKYHFIFGNPPADILIRSLIIELILRRHTLGTDVPYMMLSRPFERGSFADYRERYKSSTLRTVVEILQNELESWGSFKTDCYNSFTGLVVRNALHQWVRPLTICPYCIILGEEGFRGVDTFVGDFGGESSGRKERLGLLGQFWSMCFQEDSFVLYGTKIRRYGFPAGWFAKKICVLESETSSGLGLDLTVFEGDCVAGIPDTMKIDLFLDQLPHVSRPHLSAIIAAVPCGLGETPRELELGLPGFVAHDLSKRTKEFSYLTALFLGIFPAQALYRGSFLSSVMGVHLERQSFTYIEDQLSKLDDDDWTRFTITCLRDHIFTL